MASVALQRLEQRMIPLLVILAIVGYPLVAMLPTVAGVDSHYFSVVFRSFVLLASLLVIVLTFVPLEKQVAVSVPMLLCAACWAVLLVRYFHDVVLLGVSPSATLGPFPFVAYFLGLSVVPSLALFRRLPAAALIKVHRNLLYLMGIAVAFYSLYFARFVEDAAYVRPQADALNAITYASLGAMLVLVALTYPFPRSPRLALPVRSLAVLLGGYALITSASRGPLIALALPLLVLFHRAMRQQRLSRGAAWSLTVACAVALAAVLGLLLLAASHSQDRAGESFLVSRMLNFSQDASTLERVHLIASSWQVFMMNPLVGGAVSEPTTQSYPHNILLEGLMVGGVLLGLLVATILTIAVRLGWAYLNDRGDASFIGALLMFQVVMSMLSGSLYLGPEFWSLFALAAANRRVLTRPSFACLLRRPSPGLNA